MVQATTRTRKQRTESAITHALARRWQEAADENRGLIEEQPEDLEAANRLGKALTELGDVKGAIAAYQRALAIDGANPIARKNLAKLEAEPPEAKKGRRAAKAAPAGGAIRPDQLIDESGKSAVLNLHKPNSRALKRLSASDPVQLEPGEHGVNVKSSTRALLGHLDPRAGQRLRRLIEGGNRYDAAIRSIGDDGVTVVVRESYRDSSLLDEASFLTPSAAERKRSTPRAYTRSSIVKRVAPAAPPSEDDSADEPDPWRAQSSDDGDNELQAAGFGETDADDAVDDEDDEGAEPPDSVDDEESADDEER